MNTSNSIEQASYGTAAGFDLQQPHDGHGESQSPDTKRAFSKLQFALLVAVAILMVAFQMLVLHTYFQSAKTASEFEDSSFLFTTLADIQRESLLLQIETDAVLADVDSDISGLELRRALLANQLRLQSIQASDDPGVIAAIGNIRNDLEQYDELLSDIKTTAVLGQPLSSTLEGEVLEERIDEILAGVQLQVKNLYDREEQGFFGAFKTTLITQRTSQILLLVVDGVSLTLGVVLAFSLTRSVRALNAENSERRKAEEALRVANETLERRVEERTEELSGANERLQREVFERALAQRELRAFTMKLEESNRELQSFASIAAHDLQEPLRKVQAFGDRLKAKYSEELGEQGRDYLIRMQDASGRMAKLINDLLTYSRVTTKAQPFVKVDLAQVANEVVSDLEIRIEELKGSVELGSLSSIDAEPLQMRQLIQNLIGNGLKYHRPEVPPVVKVSAQLMKGKVVENEPSIEYCKITVEDNGIGFEEKYVDRIFGIFQRLHTRNDYEGTGVGLAICKKIVERHGGKITATSVPDEGSTFVVSLPVNQKKRRRGK